MSRFCSWSQQTTLVHMFSSRLLRRMFVASAILKSIIASAATFFASSWISDSPVDPERARSLLWVLAGVECVGITGLSYYVLGRGIRPIAAINDAADKIAAGDYGHRVHVSNRDEFGKLAETLNRV